MGQMTQAGIQRWLTGGFGREMTVYDEIGSTNDAAKLLARNGAPHGAAVLAERQSAGKGRLGRRFYSPPGSGIYMTTILRPELPVERSVMVTPAAAVAAARAIRRVTGAEVKIKWVNDLYLEGKKLCGILAESAVGEGGGLLYTVVGIGVNVTTGSFPPELAGTATALSAVCAEPVDRERLAAAVLDELETVCGQLESREFLAEYRERSCVIGKTVTLANGEQRREARVLGIDGDARLIAEAADGERLVIGAGEVSLKGDWR